MNTKSILFTAPGRAELVEEAVPRPGAHEALVRVHRSSISSGSASNDSFRFSRLTDAKLDSSTYSAAHSASMTRRFVFIFGFPSSGMRSKHRGPFRPFVARQLPNPGALDALVLL